jgi:hypothetical protein
MNVEIGAEAALFPEKEYINEIFVAVDHAKMMVKLGKEESNSNDNSSSGKTKKTGTDGSRTGQVRT